MTDLRAKLEAGGKRNPFWICGPCVAESHEVVARVAETLKNLSERLSIPVVFKASFDKANRTSYQSFRGPGVEDGLRELLWVKQTLELPVLTDVHETAQVSSVSEVADIIQVPAFLSRQTDLIAAVCRSGRPVNVKKGQFMSPVHVQALVEKLRHFGATDFWITERGVTFGYQRLVVDFAAFPEIESTGAHLVLDVTHSVQLPGAAGQASGGIREAIPYLAKAGAAAGVYGIFAETHPDPAVAKSDGLNAWPLTELENLMKRVKRVAEISHGP